MSNRRIATLRKQNQWTQEEVAKIVGVSKSHYSNIENGNRLPSYTIIIELQNIFGENIESLLKV